MKEVHSRRLRRFARNDRVLGMLRFGRKDGVLVMVVAVALLAGLVLPLPRAAAGVGVQAPGVGQGYVDEEIERAYQPAYLALATGDPCAEDHPVYPWPFPFDSIGHTIASYQYYGGNPYFHHGIDIMAPDGTQVYTQSGGQIVNVGNYGGGSDYYWEVAVLDPDGYIWQFHHIEESTIPDYIWNKYYEYLANPGEGGFVDPGTHIGNIIEWPVISFGKRFNHIHLNILGQGSKYVNGFEFHQGLPDDDVPEILQVGLLQNGQIYYGDEIEGPYSLYVHARDLVLDDVYYLPPYEVTYSVDAGPTHTVWRFDTLPGGADDEMYVEDYYVVPPTCGDYECREFYVDLGFAPFEPEAFPVDPGPHTVLVTARDYVGNQTSQTYGWTVTGGTMHVQAIALRSFGTGATRLLLSFIRAVDGEEQGVDQASMSVEWTFPNGATIEREKLTTTNGLAAFAMLSRQTGEHQICVTGLAKAGFTYEPDQNGETCDTLILP